MPEIPNVDPRFYPGYESGEGNLRVWTTGDGNVMLDLEGEYTLELTVKQARDVAKSLGDCADAAAKRIN